MPYVVKELLSTHIKKKQREEERSQASSIGTIKNIIYT